MIQVNESCKSVKHSSTFVACSEANRARNIPTSLFAGPESVLKQMLSYAHIHINKQTFTFLVHKQPGGNVCVCLFMCYPDSGPGPFSVARSQMLSTATGVEKLSRFYHSGSCMSESFESFMHCGIVNKGERACLKGLLA
jgi:hypothetical protein